jgi:hypothetical protein
VIQFHESVLSWPLEADALLVLLRVRFNGIDSDQILLPFLSAVNGKFLLRMITKLPDKKV